MRHLPFLLVAAVAATAFLPSVDPAGPDDPLPAYAATPDEAVIRPGAGMIEPGGDRGDLPMTELDAYCTYNWLFHELVEPDPVTGEVPTPRAYIGTAAHCTDEVGERVATFGYDEGFGTVVYDSDDIGSLVDFSLIELDADAVGSAHPQMFGFLAPTGYVDRGELAVGDVLRQSGYGVVLGQNDLTREGRYGVVTAVNEDEYVAQTMAQLGDSGSPFALDDDGRAVGIVSRYGFDQTPPSTDVGPLIPWILEHLEDAGLRVALSTVEG